MFIVIWSVSKKLTFDLCLYSLIPHFLCRRQETIQRSFAVNSLILIISIWRHDDVNDFNWFLISSASQTAQNEINGLWFNCERENAESSKVFLKHKVYRIICLIKMNLGLFKQLKRKNNRSDLKDKLKEKQRN